MQLELKHNGQQVMSCQGHTLAEQTGILVAFQQLLEQVMQQSGMQVVEFLSHGEGKFVRITKEEGKLGDVIKERPQADEVTGD